MYLLLKSQISQQSRTSSSSSSRTIFKIWRRRSAGNENKSPKEAGHYGDPVGLDEMARTMHVSTFYFCKMFKRATGLTFTDYLGRVRVEKAKNLLLNPHLRVSEIAYTVGFQSLTHFNRVFRKLTGESPTD